LRENLDSWRDANYRVALVPTMGNLHAGHLSLTSLARAHADKVICSIFVNPTQFGVGEDFKSYPRTPADDVEILAEQGAVDLLFMPEVDTIYPYGTDSAVSIRLPALSKDLCGAARPDHFNGVASVVLRLLNLVMPNILVLGEKDYQQRILLQRMVTDLHLPTEVIGAAIYREPDGLAMSSRNRYLNSQERAVAPELYTSIMELANALREGQMDYEELTSVALRRIAASGFEPDYITVRRARDLAPPEIIEPGDEQVVLGAARLGRARLIDNVRV
jgi:pantoate--beta-alanine ligase